jgi:fucose 4-O-acetylase-like acetyltransferase
MVVTGMQGAIGPAEMGASNMKPDGAGGKEQASSRLAWLDSAKGIGILLVVVGHIWTSGIVRDNIYAFHMPLFFLLAGYTARPKESRAFLIAQCRMLAIPYIAFLLTLVLADQLIEHFRGLYPIFRSWDQALWAMLVGGSELRGPFTIFWFVPCLMVARIMQNALLLRWPSPMSWRWVAAMALSLAIGLELGALTDFSPLGLLTVPVALPFLWLGSLWRLIGYHRTILSIAVVASAASFVILRLIPLNMKIGDYGNPITSLPTAILLSLGVVGVAKLLPPALFGGLGRRSLSIMFLHVPVIHFCTPYLSKTELLGAALAISLVVNLALSHIIWGRRYFLGQYAGTK